MPLEDLVGPNKFIDDLVKEWPLGIDPFAEGDDHIRGVKNVLANSFPTIAEARYPVSFLLPPAGESEEKNGGTEIGAGTTAQRPASGSIGALRWNTETGYLEAWDGASWKNLIAMTAQDNTFSRDNTFSGQSTFTSLLLATALARFEAGVIAESNGAGLADLGAGTINAENGVYESGVKLGRDWTYGANQNLSGTQVVLGDIATYPTLAEAVEIEVLLKAARNSTNGSFPPRVRLGGVTSGIFTSGYEGAVGIISGNAAAVGNVTGGFTTWRASNYQANFGIVGTGRITRHDPAGDYYAWEIQCQYNNANDKVSFSNVRLDMGEAIDSVVIQVDSGTMLGEARLRFR